MAEMEDKSETLFGQSTQKIGSATLAELGDRSVWPHQTPALRWLREDFVQRLLAQLPTLARGQWHLRLAGAAVGKRSQFLTSVEEKTCCYGLRPAAAAQEPADQPAPAAGERSACGNWIEFTPSIAFPILNCLLGGSSDDRFIPQRPLTSIERRLLLRPAQDALAALMDSWPDPARPALTIDGDVALEPAVPHGGDIVLTVTFDLGLDRQAGTLRLSLDYGLLPALSSPVAAMGQKDSVLEISVAMAESSISSQELADLKAGDILTGNEPTQDEVVIRVGGIPKFIGKLGVCNGRRAVTILRRIS